MGVRSIPEQDPGHYSENGNFVLKVGNPFRKRAAGMDGKAYGRDEERGSSTQNPERGQPGGGSRKREFGESANGLRARTAG